MMDETEGQQSFENESMTITCGCGHVCCGVIELENHQKTHRNDINDKRFRVRGNVLIFDEINGFDRLDIVVNNSLKKSDSIIMIQSDGFCPIGLRYIYDGFMLDFIFDDLNFLGTVCNH